MTREEIAKRIQDILDIASVKLQSRYYEDERDYADAYDYVVDELLTWKQEVSNDKN